MSSISKIWNKLRNPEYRKSFVASQVNIGIPFQLRALLKYRGWTQDQLAERSGMLQPRISAMLKPGKTRPNIETLRRLAEAFDCALIVRFAPFSELARWSQSFDPERFQVPDFEHDTGLVERMPVVSEDASTGGSFKYSTLGGTAVAVNLERATLAGKTRPKVAQSNNLFVFSAQDAEVTVHARG